MYTSLTAGQNIQVPASLVTTWRPIVQEAGSVLAAVADANTCRHTDKSLWCWGAKYYLAMHKPEMLFSVALFGRMTLHVACTPNY